MSKKNTETQVLIIGGGIIGTAIARELSKYKVEVCLVEKEPAIGFGVTKGSQGSLHGGAALFASRLVKWFDRTEDVEGYIRAPLHLKEKLNISGRPIFLGLQPFLKAKIHKCGMLFFANDEAELKALEVIREVVEELGFKDISLLDRNQIREKEPGVDVSSRIGALYDPEDYTISPTEWAIAFAENAQQNGTHILLNTEVKGIDEKKEYYSVKTNNGTIKAEWVINVAGMFSDDIAAMLDKIDWNFFLFEHQFLVLENRGYISHLLFEMPIPMQPRLMIPTPEGNILSGVTMEMHTDLPGDKYDHTTTRAGLDHIAGIPQSFVPGVQWDKNIIRTFKSYLHFNTRNPDDYLIEWPRERFLNMIVCPPGLAPSAALAQEAVKMLEEKGLDLVEKSDFNPYREIEPRFIELPTEEKNKKIQDNPAYGHIICRCEKTCEQEVREAVGKGVRTLDEMKWRVRTGMGRCQGGFCTSRVLKIMSEELGVSPLEIKQKGGNSYILDHETKAKAEGR